MPWCLRPSLNTVCFSYITTSLQGSVRGFKMWDISAWWWWVRCFSSCSQLLSLPACLQTLMAALPACVYPAPAVKGRWNRAAMFGPAAHILSHCPTVWATKANGLCFGRNSVFLGILGYFLLNNLEKHSAASFFVNSVTLFEGFKQNLPVIWKPRTYCDVLQH